jgi:hypothetical protein
MKYGLQGYDENGDFVPDAYPVVVDTTYGGADPVLIFVLTLVLGMAIESQWKRKW